MPPTCESRPNSHEVGFLPATPELFSTWVQQLPPLHQHSPSPPKERDNIPLILFMTCPTSLHHLPPHESPALNTDEFGSSNATPLLGQVAIPSSL